MRGKLLPAARSFARPAFEKISENRKKTGLRSEAYSFLICHGHLLSSGCLFSPLKKNGTRLRPWRIRQGLFLCASRRPNSDVSVEPATITSSDAILSK
jgi:hypothetical protein